MAKYLLIAALTLLAACAGRQDATQGAAKNPAEYCRGLGQKEGSEGFDNCVSNFIHRYCMQQGLAVGGPEYAQCEADLRQATFLRQQLQMRGF